MANAFISLIVTGAIGTALTLMLFLSKNIIRKHFPSHWLYCMWAIVLVIMILPIKIQLPSKINTVHGEKNNHSPGEVVFVVSQPEHIDDTVHNGKIPTDSENNNIVVPETDNEKEYRFSNILRIVSYIWLVCAASLFAYKIIAYFVFYIYAIKNSTKSDIPEIRKYTKRKIRTRICPALSSPLMTGVLFPVLFLPDAGLSGEKLENVLTHETIHLKRFDILLKWFSMAVSCIHFYNPAVYLACKELSEECEISCDALVVKNMNKEQRRAYVETILSLLSGKKSVRAPLTTGMTGSKSLLRTRFTLIKERKSTGMPIFIISATVAVILIILFCGLSGIVGGLAPQIEAESTETATSDINISSNADTQGSYIGMINAENTSLIDVFNGNELVMTIPTAVAEQFPAFDKTPGETNLIIFCGKIDDFLWAGVTTKGVMSKSHTNICTSSDGGTNWFVGTDGYIGKGIVEKIWFISEKEGFISYSGGGYGKGTSKTSDGGRTWEHFMEYGYSMPIEAENALTLLKHQLIIAYENTYGSYTPLSIKPTQAVPDSEYLRYIIENLEITKEDDEYYTVPVIWDFLIEKETGRIYKFYNGLDKVLTLFDPYSPTALSFAG